MNDEYEAVVIGSGFGGAISACRLGKRWPGRVLVLERGKRYPMGSFPRSPHALARNFWNVSSEDGPRRRLPLKEQTHGMFDIRSFKHLNVVIAAGLGGGSLIYANVFLEPPAEVFDARWPATCKKSELAPYYRVAREVLGARPIPQNGDPRRRVVRTELFQRVARELGRKSELADINVFFGNDFDDPLPIGHQDRNRYGALQTSCTYCAECDLGCNTHSKNTLDLNYLHVAENRYGTELRTEHLVERIAPLDRDGRDDAGADGSHGYRVYFRDLASESQREASVRAKRVVLSAGSLGSTELLLRCKTAFHTLPKVSERLGHQFSPNGDFLSLIIAGKADADPNYGPVITQRMDFNLLEDFNPEHAFVLEDASYPAFAAWFAEGQKPGFMRLGALWHTLRSAFDRFLRGESLGSIGYAFSGIMSGDLSYRASVLLFMGIDKSNGIMSLDRYGRVDIDWPYRDSMPLYDAISKAGEAFRRAVAAKSHMPLPTWYRPLRKNIGVHTLGGCVLGDDEKRGVVSAARDSFGQVFGYQGLYVADAAIIPSAVGANPAATISALSEMVAEGITGIAPDADL
ncbi:MAG: GMC oxidoreductase [Gammaproteobacteria bacterium]|nr:GMC oxidoreductase [Gammaproteobacteria bacterium]